MSKPPSSPPADTVIVAAPPRPRSRWYMTIPLMIAVGTLAFFAWQQPPTNDPGGEPLLRFAGRLHPSLTHLPIGLLLLVPILDLLGVFRRSRHLWSSGQLVLWLATLSAILAAASGYLLARTDGRVSEDVLDHQWAGIALAGASCVALMFRSLARGGRRRKSWGLLYVIAIGFTLVCLVASGHLGGKITHGDDYLSEYAPEPFKSWIEDVEEVQEKVMDRVDRATPDSIPTTTTAPTIQTSVEPATRPVEVIEPMPAPVGDLPVEQRTVFGSIVTPIFAQHCFECHGAKKVKGNLRLDSYARIMAGGESGSTVVPNSVADSELARVIALPRDDDDAMPPDKKPGLSAVEIEAIRWWIANGASQDLTIGQANALPDGVRALSK